MLTETHSRWTLLWSWPACYSFQNKSGFANSSHYLVWSTSLPSYQPVLLKESVFIHCSTSFAWAIPHDASVTLKRSHDGTQTSYSSFLLPMHCVFLYRYLRWATRESVNGSLVILPFKYFSGPYSSTSLWALVSIPGKPRLTPFSLD